MLFYRAPRGRIDAILRGRRARGNSSRKIAKRESDPWLLATSPKLDLTAVQIVAINARRMQIEQSFRNLKSHHYGVGFEASMTRTGTRLATLLLLLALATFVAWIAARTAARDVARTAALAMAHPSATKALSWHRIEWWLLREQRWRIDLRGSMAGILLDADAVAPA